MPVQQHPIPQDVTNYKFRLVGDMTLKQFIQLAVGIVLGVITWGSPLPFFFKYPLSILLVGMGIGMAFVPIEGRPLDQWIIAFIKSVYSPTIFTWQQSTPASTTTVPETNTPTASPLPKITNQLPIPSTPTIPNIIVGLVLSADNIPLSDTIIEITKDTQTVRATKTNKLGQFMFLKPLDNGLYLIHTQKQNFSFNSYSLDLNNQIVRPLRIQAT